MTLNLEETEKLARAATPGPWEYDGLGRVVGADGDEVDGGFIERVDSNGFFIAHMHPERTLAMVAELKQYQHTNKVQAERIRELKSELKLAIAHDRQPYPTADAYELACKVRDEARQERDEALAYARGLTGLLELWLTHPRASVCALAVAGQTRKTLTTPPPAFLQSQREKMERVKQAIGWIRMNAGIAHDGNNVNSDKQVHLENAEKASEALKLLGEA